MPELPEVEISARGIKPHLQEKTIKELIIRQPSLRIPVPFDINECCAGKKIHAITRRAKYILLHLSEGHIIIHLGMSGHLRIMPSNTAPEKHDHIDLVMTHGITLRYCDPRRFGLFLYIKDSLPQHFLLTHLGPEPLSQQFNSDYLYKKTRGKNQAIKSFIMDNKFIVGVGNIYATESLFFSGIHPQTPAKNLSLEDSEVLTVQIKKILKSAIKAGGTTLKDFYTFDGTPGYFSFALKIYGRKKQPCFQCGHLIETLVIGGRHSAFCPYCQPVIIEKNSYELKNKLY